MVRSAALVTRMSAGMRSPVVNMTRSPGTSCAAMTLDDVASSCSSAGVAEPGAGSLESGVFSPWPGQCGERERGDGPGARFRTRWAWLGTRWLSASIDLSERYSCMKPTLTTMVTAAVMLTASSMFPTRTEAAAEASRRTMSGSWNCLRKRIQTGSGSSWGISLGP